MPHTAGWVRDMTGALRLLEQVAAFYAKYHMLEAEERLVMEHRLKETHHEWAMCSGPEQQHVDFLEVVMRELRVRYREWMQDELVARKRWRVHPGQELHQLQAQVASTTAKMQQVMLHHSTTLEAVVVKKEAWD